MSELKKLVKKEDHLESPALKEKSTVRIFDAMSIFHKVGKPEIYSKFEICLDLIDTFFKKIMEYDPDEELRVCVDRYLPYYLKKNMRAFRGGNKIYINCKTSACATQTERGERKTYRCLIRQHRTRFYAEDDICYNILDNVHYHEEADTLITLHAVNVEKAIPGRRILVESTDTDH